jgi:heme oxygenase
MARLTVYPPNHQAADLAAFIRKKAKEDVGFSCPQKFCSNFWITFAVIGFGFAILSLVVAGFVTFLIISCLFVGLPLLKLYSMRMEEYYHDSEVSCAAHRALQDQLNERLRAHLLKKHGGILSREYYQLALEEEEEESQVVDLISDETFNALKSSGYASTTAWSVYASLWASLMAQVGNETEEDTVLQDLHSQWLKIIKALTGATKSFVTNMKYRRITAYARLARHNQGNAMGQLGDLFGLCGTARDIVELKQALGTIRRDTQDIHDQFKEGKLATKNILNEDAVSTGIHPISAR